MNPSNVTENAGTPVRPQKLTDALKVLDQAIMNEGVDLKDLVSKDYSHLQDALKDFAPQVGETLRAGGRQAMERIQNYTAPAIQKTKQAVAEADRQVKANPWPILAGTAIGALAIGFLLGRSPKK
jgi:ElaB/YqjD/DUF883 family membrane-anchored ribosome-binding protein